MGSVGTRLLVTVQVGARLFQVPTDDLDTVTRMLQQLQDGDHGERDDLIDQIRQADRVNRRAHVSP